MTSRAKSRPPRLESRVGEVQPAPPPTPEQLLERAKVAGSSSAPGPTELRRLVERIVAGDRLALGALHPIEGCSVVDAWAAVTDAFGATADHARIDASRTLAMADRAAGRVRAVAAAGARIALATAAPASLLTVHLAFARVARAAGGDLFDTADIGPLRADGRTPRWLRTVDGVAAITDGEALCPTHDAGAAREWLFVMPRPALVVADGPFAEVATEAGIEVVALAGLDRSVFAIAAARGMGVTLVPLRTDQPPRAYGPVIARIDDPGDPPEL